MRQLTPDGEDRIRDVAQRCGFSSDAVKSMLESLETGMPGMAQFDHPEFGGRGQWMRGGMTMISAMFDSALKERVERLCGDLSRSATQPGFFAADAQPEESASAAGTRAGRGWWPGGLGRPASAGAQNGVRYAYFSASRRLAIETDGRVTLYDTLDHRISGVAQQQSVGATLTFQSQRGIVDIDALPVVTDERTEVPGTQPIEAPSTERGNVSSAEVIGTIEQLHELHRRGVLSDDEFSATKTELLRRI